MHKMMVRILPVLVVLSFSLFISHAQTNTPDTPTTEGKIRIGILGDSNSDEYRADDNRAGGTKYAKTTLSWVELLAKYRDIDFGAWGDWGGERRSGYEYNWARSGATTESMINDGQDWGVANQAKEGKVDYAIIFIGVNDFNTWNGTYDDIYSGTMSDKALDDKINTIVSDIKTAVERLQQARDDIKIILTTFADPGLSPEFLVQFPNADKRRRISDAISEINHQLKDLADSHSVKLADLGDFAHGLISRVNLLGNFEIGGEAISLLTQGDEPHHFQLGDHVGHSGTVGSGLIANFFIDALNSYDLSIQPFSDDEILTNAGITPKK